MAVWLGCGADPMLCSVPAVSGHSGGGGGGQGTGMWAMLEAPAGAAGYHRFMRNDRKPSTPTALGSHTAEWGYPSGRDYLAG